MRSWRKSRQKFLLAVIFAIPVPRRGISAESASMLGFGENDREPAMVLSGCLVVIATNTDKPGSGSQHWTQSWRWRQDRVRLYAVGNHFIFEGSRMVSPASMKAPWPR
jgi:hypothetical protein